MKDEKFFNFDGSPKEGIRATRTEVGGDNPLTKQQLNEATAVYAKFTEMKNLSLAKTFSTWKTLPDGTLVHISSSHGQDRVTIRPTGGKAVRLYPVFEAIPVSDDHPWGYAGPIGSPPNTDPTIHKASWQWVNYPFSDPPPNLKNKDSTYLQHPGSVAWWNEDITWKEVPVVVSWCGPQHRYGFFTAKDVPNNTAFPSVIWGPSYWNLARMWYPNIATANLPSEHEMQISTRIVRQEYVWINGVRVGLGAGYVHKILCAALQKVGNDLYLVVVSTTALVPTNVYVWKKKLPGLPSLMARTTLTIDLPGGLAANTIANFSVAKLTTGQNPYFNKSATKFIGIFKDLTPTYVVGGPQSGSVDVVETFDMTSLTFSQYFPLTDFPTTREYRQYNTTIPPPPALPRDTTDGSSEDYEQWTLLAADFVDDEPVCVYLKAVYSAAGATVYHYGPSGWLESTTGSGTAELTLTLLKVQNGATTTLMELGTYTRNTSSSPFVWHELWTGQSSAQIWGNLSVGDFVVAAFYPSYQEKTWNGSAYAYTAQNKMKMYTYINWTLQDTQTVQLAADVAYP